MEATTSVALPSGTVSFLFTDIEGSTRLLESLRARYADVLADQRRILRGCFSRWNGHEVDTQGDAFFVAFGRAGDAVRCAIEAQHDLATWTWPAGVEVRVRMGIHSGEPLVAATGYVGMDVHRAARIAAAGHGGQILISATTRDLVSDELPPRVALRDLGSYRLKDLRDEIRIFQISGADLQADFPALKTLHSTEQPPTPGEPPYRGLQPFEAEDAARFFGREPTVRRLADLVGRSRFVALIGASGSGKSSILRAGLIPTLRQEGSSWRIHLLTPTEHPLEALADALATDATAVEVSELAEGLRHDPRSLALYLRRHKPRRRSADQRVLLAIDQLEEVFTLCRDEGERAAFFESLAHGCGLDEGSADSPPETDRARMVAAIRADFYGFLSPYPRVREASATSQLYVGPMTSDELRRAIEQPAIRGGWEFVPGLVDLLLHDIGDEPGGLPLLSHALLETWRRRRGVMMTLRSYAESGGVRGGIARTADRVLEELTADQRPIARDIFTRLTELGEGTQDTRRRVDLAELLTGADEEKANVRTVIGVLADARLITVSEDRAEVAHEALIREWPTLRDWLRADRDDLRLHRRMTEAAREWELSGFDEAVLYRGARLNQIRDWATSQTRSLNDTERRFLRASVASAERREAAREAARRREQDAAEALAAAETRRAADAARSAARLRRRAFLLGGALVVAAVLAVAAVVLARQANDNAELARQGESEARANAALAQQREHEANANLAAAQSERLGADADAILLRGGDPDLAALLALNGLHAQYTTEADRALQRAVRADHGFAFAQQAPVDDIAVTPDDSTLITASGGDVVFWDTRTGEVIDRLTDAYRKTPDASHWHYLQLSHDGRTLLVSTRGGPGAIYRLPGRTIVPGACPSLLDPGTRTLSADGKTLVTARVRGPHNTTYGEIVIEQLDNCAQGRGLISDIADELALSPDGSLLAGIRGSSEGDSQILVWDVTSAKLRYTIGGFGGISDVEFSPDGGRLVTADENGTARVFDVRSGAMLQVYSGHAGVVLSARFSPDGSRLITSSADKTARVWDVATGKEIGRYHHGQAVVDAVISSDGAWVYSASADATARRWSTSAPAEDFTYDVGPAAVGALAFSPDGTRLAASSGDRIAVYDVSQPMSSPIMSAYAPGTVRLSFSPNGQSLLTSSPSGATLWDTQTSGVLQTFTAAGTSEYGLAASFTPNGQRVLVGSQFRTRLGLWDVRTGALVRGFDGRLGTLSSDGERVATWLPGRLSVFVASTGEERAITLPGASSRPVDIAFSPDGSVLVTGGPDGVVEVWDVASLASVRQLPGPTNAIRRVAFTPDGASVLASSDDGNAWMWDLDAGRATRLFPGHAGLAVTGLAVSPDQLHVALGGADGTVVVAPLSLTDLESKACAMLARDLTNEERAAYSVDSIGPTCP